MTTYTISYNQTDIYWNYDYDTSAWVSSTDAEPGPVIGPFSEPTSGGPDDTFWVDDVGSGDVATGVVDGGEFSVFGLASGVDVEVGGYLEVSGGTARDVTVDSGGEIDVFGGSASEITVDSSGEIWVFGGSASEITVASGYLEVSGGAVSDATVESSGEIDVYGGSASEITVASGGYVEVFSGASWSDGTVESGGSAVVYGSAYDVTVDAGGELILEDGFTADPATISAATVVSVESGLTLDGYSMASGADWFVEVGGAVKSVIVTSGGDLHVLGSASDVTVETGGQEEVYAGSAGDADALGVASDVIISGGTVNVNSGGQVSGTVDFATTSSGEGSGGLLWYDNPSMPDIVISGFANGDTIDLAAVAYDSSGSATLDANNVLDVSENGQTYKLAFDSSENFSGSAFALSSDHNGGTDIVLTTAPVLSIEDIDGSSVDISDPDSPDTISFDLHLSAPAGPDGFVVDLEPDATSSDDLVDNSGVFAVDSQYDNLDWSLDPETINNNSSGLPEVTIPSGEQDAIVTVDVDEPASLDQPSKQYFTLGVAVDPASQSTGVTVNASQNVAVGTIKQTHSNPVIANVLGLNVPALQPYADLLEVDFQAALDRIVNALGSGDLKDVTIDVNAVHFTTTAIASASPWDDVISSSLYDLLSPSAEPTGKSVAVPSTLLAYFGLDSDPVITVNVDPSKLALFYDGDGDVTLDETSDDPTYDATTVLTHELLHGFGFYGASASASPQLAFDTHVELDLGPGGSIYAFDDNGTPIPLVGNLKSPIGEAHISPVYAPGDLMNPSYNGPETPISTLDTGIMQALGYAPIKTTTDFNLDTVSSGNIVSDVDVDNQFVLDVLAGGTSNNATIAGTGVQIVETGGSGSGTIVDSGGVENVYGSDSDSIVNDGGYQYVLAGATAESTLVNDPGLQVVVSGGNANNVTIQGGEQDDYGTASGANVESGGLQIVEDDGLALNTSVELGGSAVVSGGGTLDGATIAGGRLDLQSGSIAKDSIAFNGSGGTLQIDGTTMPANTISGFGSGDAIDLSGVAYDSQGTATLESGNVLQIAEGGQTYDLQFDPNQVFNGSFRLIPDRASGTDITLGPATLFDFNGSGLSDILWRNTNGDAAIWISNGSGGFSNYYDLGVVPTSWQIAGVGDFTGDGKSDILWSNTANGQIGLWESNGSGGFSDLVLGDVPTSWQIAGVGDFTGDGLADILWRNTDGDTALWISNGSGGFSNYDDLGVVPTSWQIAGVGDFTGDGKSDILWRNTDGDTALWISNGSGGFSNYDDLGVVSTSWQIAGVGDFNGNGMSDILWRNTDGDTALWISNGSGGFSNYYDLGVVSTSWQIVGVGDLTGDGKSDILWSNTNGDTALWESNGSGGFSYLNLGVVPSSWKIQSG